MYRITEKQILSDVTKLMQVEAPHIVRNAKPGQFVIVISHEHGERIPLTIADFDRQAGTITLIFQEVGKSTMEMGTMEVGESFYSIAGPLGHPTKIENYGTVACVAGGVGIAPMYPITRALKDAGNHVISIIGARNQSLLFWEERMRAVSDELVVCTDDGSYGRKALVTEPLRELLTEQPRNGPCLGNWPGGNDGVFPGDGPFGADSGQPELDHDRRNGYVAVAARSEGRPVRVC
jgi:ferredoxin--NADP+ reductase